MSQNGYEQLTIKQSLLVGKPLLYFTTCLVSTAVLCFGYEQGVVSSLLVNERFKDYFDNPSAASIGTMVAILEIGALISSLLSGKISDRIGRRRSIRYGSIIFTVGGVLQSCAPTFTVLTIARLISGFGVGILTTIVPVYQTEISPPHSRGKLACVEFTGNIIGYASSIWADYFCSYIDSNISWRLPLFIQSIIAFGLFLGSYIIVESPRWLLNHDHDAEGIVVIADLTSNGDVQDDRAISEFREIKEAIIIDRLEGESSYYHMFKRYKARVLIAMSSQAFAQMNGINVISYYAPLVFEQAGWKGRDAILMTGINSLFYVASTLPPWVLVDKWGRRPILLSGAIIMGVSLYLISYSLYLNTETTRHIVVLLVIVFNAGFGFSFGPIPWLYPAEIAPLKIRSKVASLSTASNWFFNWLVGEMTPILQELITYRLYLIHSTSCFISFFVVYYFYPETAGVGLEDMDSLFDDQSSTYSYQSTDNSHDDNIAPGSSTTNNPRSNPQNLSMAAMARQKQMLQQESPVLSPMIKKQRSETSFSQQLNSFTQANGNTQTSSMNNFNIEPPSMEEIIKFKNNSDNMSITSSLRRASEVLPGFGRAKQVDEEHGAGNDNIQSLGSSPIQDVGDGVYHTALFQNIGVLGQQRVGDDSGLVFSLLEMWVWETEEDLLQLRFLKEVWKELHGVASDDVDVLVVGLLAVQVLLS
ncbi:hypothetical protein WICPIJ_008545 [Wickerhamomyces pijperi]|uniref:Major facilitator superfamily (MFS) profile domain-containing protein n=1 Tax=Wickerhamomyces pijperi TaxID=599730 RepID=A0A9P8PWQ4_WICPI|nr:hypothetical protein WICPIJ_008545 [Wickerhamomyces pijperi]